MTFSRFVELVKSKYPKAELFKHGEFAGNKINVAVVFEPFTKVYKYNGTYCEVLNKVGIKAIYKHDIDAIYKLLEMSKKTNGKEGFFGDIIDNTEKIARLEKQIADYEKNYEIV